MPFCKERAGVKGKKVFKKKKEVMPDKVFHFIKMSSQKSGDEHWGTDHQELEGDGVTSKTKPITGKKVSSHQRESK